MKKIKLENMQSISIGSVAGPLDSQINLDESGLLNDSGLIDDSGIVEPDIEPDSVFAGNGSLTVTTPLPHMITFSVHVSWTEGTISRPSTSVITINSCSPEELVESVYATWQGHYSISVIIYYYVVNPEGERTIAQILGNYSIPTISRKQKD